VLYDIIKRLKAKDTVDSELPMVIKAQLIYVIENEMCLTLCDFFIRRTGMLYFDIANLKSLREAVLKFMKDFFVWDDLTCKRYDLELQKEIFAVE